MGAIVVVLLRAGLGGRYSSAIYAYFAFGVAHYALEEVAAVYPSTAQLYFLPVAFVVTGVLGCIVSRASSRAVWQNGASGESDWTRSQVDLKRTGISRRPSNRKRPRPFPRSAKRRV